MNDIAEAVGVLPGSLYYHFASKEEVAVELLAEFNADLDDVCTREVARQQASSESAEQLVRRAAQEMTRLSLRHPAATRLRAYKPPSISTQALRVILRATSTPMRTMWTVASEAVARSSVHPDLDAGLLQFALERSTLAASLAYSPEADADEIAERMCDLFLGGLVKDLPPGEVLDRSAAMTAVQGLIASWKASDRKVSVHDRDAIIAAARSQFAKRGYDATTIRDIADAAGVRMGSLYRRVESKESILQEILDGYSARMSTAVLTALTSAESEIEALDALGRMFVHAGRRFRAESEIVKVKWGGEFEAPSPFQDYYAGSQARLRQLAEVLTRGERAGTIRTIADPTDTAELLRRVLWLPYQAFERSSETRAHQFMRRSILQGSLSGS
jgi:AcrR family transcriptional regulator